MPVTPPSPNQSPIVRQGTPSRLSGSTKGRNNERGSVTGEHLPTRTRTSTYDVVRGTGSKGGDHASAAQEDDDHHKKLPMFKGVLVPTCENMWGVIIFLRFYLIVGNAGLGNTVVIVTLSFMVALSTALSLSAIATCGTSHNLAGVYPMLARALGKEIATAIGIVD